jgi:hypothetical protein
MVKSVSISTTAYGFQVDKVYCSFNVPSFDPLNRPIICGANSPPLVVKASWPNGAGVPITGPAGPLQPTVFFADGVDLAARIDPVERLSAAIFGRVCAVVGEVEDDVALMASYHQDASDRPTGVRPQARQAMRLVGLPEPARLSLSLRMQGWPAKYKERRWVDVSRS